MTTAHIAYMTSLKIYYKPHYLQHCLLSVLMHCVDMVYIARATSMVYSKRNSCFFNIPHTDKGPQCQCHLGPFAIDCCLGHSSILSHYEHKESLERYLIQVSSLFLLFYQHAQDLFGNFLSARLSLFRQAE